MVHWDAIKSPAMICQKTWRLDRRVSDWDSVTRDFTSYHFVRFKLKPITSLRLTNHIENKDYSYQIADSLLEEMDFL